MRKLITNLETSRRWSYVAEVKALDNNSSAAVVNIQAWIPYTFQGQFMIFSQNLQQNQKMNSNSSLIGWKETIFAKNKASNVQAQEEMQREMGCIGFLGLNSLKGAVSSLSTWIKSLWIRTVEICAMFALQIPQNYPLK